MRTRYHQGEQCNCNGLEVQDNKTNIVEETRSTSTVVGAGSCVIYPPPLYCIRWQEVAWHGRLYIRPWGMGSRAVGTLQQLFTLSVCCGDDGKNCCPTCI